MNEYEKRLIIAWLGNLIDCASTLYMCSQGFIEINPVMARLIQYPPLFVFVKIGTMTALVFLLWKNRTDKKAIAASWFAAILYGAISVYYVCIFSLSKLK